MPRNRRLGPASGTSPALEWWDASRKADGLADAVWTRAMRMRTWQRMFGLTDLIHEAIYTGRPLGHHGGLPASTSLGRTGGSAPARLNILRAKVLAITSRVSGHRPLPVISADDAGWFERRFAQRASSVLRSRLRGSDVERERPLLKRDAILRGTGVLKSMRTDDGDVTVRRIPRAEVLIAPSDQRNRDPRAAFHVESMPLELALAQYGHSKKRRQALVDASTTASRADDGYYTWGDAWADDSRHVTLIHGWHLPSGFGVNDGREVTVCKGQTLVDKPWTRPRLPLSLLHWDPPVRGLWGQGLVEDLVGIQAKVNDTIRDLQEAAYYAGQLKVFLPRGSNVNKDHLRRQRHPHVVEVDVGQGIPAPQPGQIIAGDLFSFGKWLIEMMDDLSGLSRDFQAGRTQLGAGASGKAMDTLDDIQSDRFKWFLLSDSLQMVDAATLMLDEARAMWEESEAGTLATDDMAPWIAEHDWRKIEIDGGLHHLQVEPTNFLPDTRAGKFEGIAQLSQAGLIKDPTDALDLFTEPDFQRMTRKLLGPRQAVLKVLEGLADPTVPLTSLQPDSFFPIEDGIATVLAELWSAWAAMRGEPDEKEQEILQRHRDWLGLAEHQKSENEREAAMRAAANAPPAAAGGAPPGPGPAPGGPPSPGAPPGAAASPMVGPGMPG